MKRVRMTLDEIRAESTYYLEAIEVEPIGEHRYIVKESTT